MKNEKTMTMGSSIVDFYMDGFDEGKFDDAPASNTTLEVRKHRSNKERVSSRRKKAYFKSKRRMSQLSHVAHYVPDANDEAVVFGMLRSHQLPISDPVLTCGCSIGDKKRKDSAECKMFEHASDLQDEDFVSA